MNIVNEKIKESQDILKIIKTEQDLLSKNKTKILIEIRENIETIETIDNNTDKIEEYKKIINQNQLINKKLIIALEKKSNYYKELEIRLKNVEYINDFFKSISEKLIELNSKIKLSNNTFLHFSNLLKLIISQNNTYSIISILYLLNKYLQKIKISNELIVSKYSVHKLFSKCIMSEKIDIDNCIKIITDLNFNFNTDNFISFMKEYKIDDNDIKYLNGEYIKIKGKSNIISSLNFHKNYVDTFYKNPKDNDKKKMMYIKSFFLIYSKYFEIISKINLDKILKKNIEYLKKTNLEYIQEYIETYTNIENKIQNKIQKEINVKQDINIKNKKTLEIGLKLSNINNINIENLTISDIIHNDIMNNDIINNDIKEKLNMNNKYLTHIHTQIFS